MSERSAQEAFVKIRIGRAHKGSGLGMFAMEPIKRGTTIIEYVGRILTPAEGDNTNNLYIFNVSKKKDIDGSPRWNTARYINHSCRPNAEAELDGDRVFIKAKRNIMLGDEITYDYGPEYFDEYITGRKCRCVKHRGVPHHRETLKEVRAARRSHAKKAA
jgi:hypothetical protein